MNRKNNMTNSEELSDAYAFIPPHRRAEVRRRVEVLERHARGEISGRAAAKLLGIYPAGFVWLAQAWKANPSPEVLVGAGRPMKTYNKMSEEQMAVINQAVAEMPTEIVERAVERAVELARDRGVELPTWGAMTRLVGQAMTGRLPSSSPAANVDLVIEHCVVDLPIRDPASGKAFMPIGTLVTTTSNPAVLGLSLRREAPTPGSAACAFLEALNRMEPSDGAKSSPSIYLDTLPEPGWAQLRQAIGDAGFEVVGSEAADVRPPTATMRLIGREINRIRMQPRLGRRPFIARPATMPIGAYPLELGDAETFLRARWIGATDSLTTIHGSFDAEALRGRLRKIMDADRG
jgi:hypothetical protein